MANLSSQVTNPLGLVPASMSYFGANLATANGWVGNGTFANPTTTTTAADLPLQGIYATAIKFTSPTTAGTEGTNDWCYSFKTPKSGGVKTPIDIYMVPGSNFIANEWTLSIFQLTTKQPIDQQDTSGFVYLPVYTGKPSNITFMPLGDTLYTFRLCRRLNAGTNVGVLNAVIDIGLGQRITQSGVGPALTWTPTLSVGITNGTGSSLLKAEYNVSGEFIEGSIEFIAGSSPSASVATVTLPNSWTTAPSSFPRRIGAWTSNNSSANSLKTGLILADSVASNLLYFGIHEYVPAVNPTTGQAGNAIFTPNGYVTLTFRVRINQLIGSVANFGSNDVQWAADDGTNDVFGPNGALVPNVGFSTGTTNRLFAFSIQTLAQNQVVLELNRAGYGWHNASDFYPFQGGNNGSSSNFYGMRGGWSSGSVYVVEFGNQGTRIDVSTSSNGAATWASEFAIGTRFRVRNAAGGQAVPFGPYVPGVSAGLVDSAGLKGRTDGGTVAAGYVGEEISSYVTGISVNSTPSNATSISLTPGSWDVSGLMTVVSGGTTSVAMTVGINTASASFTGTQAGKTNQVGTTSNNADGGATISPVRVTVPAGPNVTYYLVVKYNTGTVTVQAGIRAVRAA